MNGPMLWVESVVATCMDYESTWFFRMCLKRTCGGACKLRK
jgi:hypothetical protein